MSNLNRTMMLVAGAGVLALIGLIVNVAFDLDNVYDMTTTTLWLLTMILAFAGVYTKRA